MTLIPRDWHWLIFGMLLILAELVVPSFTIFWFGLAALLVAAALWLAPELRLSTQLYLWAGGSCLFTFLWFRYIRPRMTDRTKAGIAREAAIGECGQVIRAPTAGQRGVVRFTTPLLGAEEWAVICEQPLAVGERVIVREVSGNALIVEKRAIAPMQ
jgi:hypothetical protein